MEQVGSEGQRGVGGRLAWETSNAHPLRVTEASTLGNGKWEWNASFTFLLGEIHAALWGILRQARLTLSRFECLSPWSLKLLYFLGP